MTTAAAWDALPDSLALLILGLVPADSRLRCSEVRRDWRRLLSSASAWSRLDLSLAGCSTDRKASDEALLCGFAAKAAGALAILDVSARAELPVATLLEVVTANAATLTTLHTTVRRAKSMGFVWVLRCAHALRRRQTLVRREALENDGLDAYGSLTACDAAALLDAAPQMTLEASVRCTAADAPRLLNNEAPFERLHMSRLSLIDTVQSTTDNVVASFEALLGAQAGQPIPPQPVHRCIAPLAAALRENTSLTFLDVNAMVTRKSAAALTEVVAALTAHPSLRVLWLTLDGVLSFERDDVALRALCALLKADAPSLRDLQICNEPLRDEALAQLIDALAHNTHLRVLSFGARAVISQAVAEKLLPAVRAATALRRLELKEDLYGAPALQAVQAMLQARVALETRHLVADKA